MASVANTQYVVVTSTQTHGCPTHHQITSFYKILLILQWFSDCYTLSNVRSQWPLTEGEHGLTFNWYMVSKEMGKDSYKCI